MIWRKVSRTIMGAGGSLGIGLAALTLLPQAGWALPGHSVRMAESWIRNNPSLQPAPNERLTINRTPSPGQRFTFQASLFPVTGANPDISRRIIRSERFTLVDHANDITRDRLEESLRTIYGPQVFDDYRQAVLLFSYPTPAAGGNPNLVLAGQVHAGERFAYWQEIAYDDAGNAYLGRFSVFLREDLPLLRQHLTRTR